MKNSSLYFDSSTMSFKRYGRRNATKPKSKQFRPIYKPPKPHDSFQGHSRGFVFDNNKLLINRLLPPGWNVTELHNNHIPWRYSPPGPIEYSPPFTINFDDPSYQLFKPEGDVSGLAPRSTPVLIIWLSMTSVLFCFLCVLRLIVYARRDFSRGEERDARERQMLNTLTTNRQDYNGEGGSMARLVNSEESPHNDSHLDLPPSYSECHTISNGIVNKTFDVTSEELPPSYSWCLGVPSGTDEVAKLHQRDSITEAQPHPDTDMRLQNVDTASNVDAEQTDDGDGTSRMVVETTINIDVENEQVASQSNTNAESGVN